MSDQCQHCTYRGDIDACLASECARHQDWIVVQLRAALAELDASEALSSGITTEEMQNVLATLREKIPDPSEYIPVDMREVVDAIEPRIITCHECKSESGWKWVARSGDIPPSLYICPLCRTAKPDSREQFFLARDPSGAAEVAETPGGAAPDGLREALAEYAHAAWAEWMKYLFSKCSLSTECVGAFVIPEGAVDRGQRQMHTAYVDLSEEEKESDRDEADKILAWVARFQGGGAAPDLEELADDIDGCCLGEGLSYMEDWPKRLRAHRCSGLSTSDRAFLLEVEDYAMEVGGSRWAARLRAIADQAQEPKP